MSSPSGEAGSGNDTFISEDLAVLKPVSRPSAERYTYMYAITQGKGDQENDKRRKRSQNNSDDHHSH